MSKKLSETLFGKTIIDGLKPEGMALNALDNAQETAEVWQLKDLRDKIFPLLKEAEDDESFKQADSLYDFSALFDEIRFFLNGEKNDKG